MSLDRHTHAFSIFLDVAPEGALTNGCPFMKVVNWFWYLFTWKMKVPVILPAKGCVSGRVLLWCEADSQTRWVASIGRVNVSRPILLREKTEAMAHIPPAIPGPATSTGPSVGAGRRCRGPGWRMTCGSLSPKPSPNCPCIRWPTAPRRTFHSFPLPG